MIQITVGGENPEPRKFTTNQNLDIRHTSGERQSLGIPVQILNVGLPNGEKSIAGFIANRLNLSGVVRIKAHYHLGENPICAIGCNPFEVPEHGTLFTKTAKLLCQQGNDSVHEEEFKEGLRASTIDGFVEQVEGEFKNFVIRINANAELKANPKLLVELVEKYKQAYRIASECAVRHGGEVKFTYVGNGIEILKAMGLLTKVQVDAMAKDLYYKYNTERLGRLEYFYKKNTGTRYFSPDQLAVLFDIASDRDVLLEQVRLLVDKMNPTFKNSEGYREYKFMLYDSESQSFNDIGSQQSVLYQALKDLNWYLSFIDAENWSNSIGDINRQISDLIICHNTFCHYPFSYEEKGRTLQQKMSDEVCVRLVRKLIEPAEEGFGLDKNVFSSTMRPVEAGYFDLSDPKKPFIFSEKISPELKAIVERFLDQNDCSEAHYLMVLAPVKPLTHDQHPPEWTEKMGDTNDNSIVLCLGSVGGGIKVSEIYRDHTHPIHYWLNAFTDFAKDLAKQFRGHEKELTEIITLVKQIQIALMNDLYSKGHKSEGGAVEGPVPNYRQEDIGDRTYLVRRFIDGARLDHVDRHNLTDLEVKHLVKELAPLMAVHLVAQKSAINLHELVLQNGGLNPLANPGHIINIGTSETFCNSFGIKSGQKKRIAELTRHSEDLLSSFLFSMIALFEYGQYAMDHNIVGEKDMQTLVMDIERVFLPLFEGKLKEIRDRKLFNPEKHLVDLENKRRELSELGLDIPQEFDLVPHFKLHRRLANLSDRSIGEVSRTIWDRSKVLREWFKAFVKDENGQVLKATAKEYASLIETFHALATNHLSNKSGNEDLKFILNGMMLEDKSKARLDFSSFALNERKWLLVLADVSLWLKEIHSDGLHTLINLALNSANALEFFKEVPKELQGIHLSEATAFRFYEAMHGFYNLSCRQDDGDVEQDASAESFPVTAETNPATTQMDKALKICSWGELTLDDIRYSGRLH